MNKTKNVGGRPINKEKNELIIKLVKARKLTFTEIANLFGLKSKSNISEIYNNYCSDKLRPQKPKKPFKAIYLLPDETKSISVKRLFNEGFTVNQLKRYFNISHQRVYQLLKKK